jgi:DNA-binding Lrp family transcriptional regulator
MAGGFSELKNEMNEIERKVVKAIQHGMPKSLTPYEDMAKEASVTTDELLGVLKVWAANKKLRRIGAIVNHFEVGLSAGMMTVWQVEPDRLDEVGQQLAEFDEVSHAYIRPSSDKWPYNFYTMVHGTSLEEVEETLRKMSDASGVKEYVGLDTIKELKKVPPTYIVND